MAPPTRIDITVPDDVLAQNEQKRQRLAQIHRFEPVDRVPVLANVNQWYLLDQRGITPGEYVASPRDNLIQQLLNMKWRWEQLIDDQPIRTDHVSVGPDLGCLRGEEFEMEIVWPDDQPPKCTHPLTAPEQIDELEVPAPDGALNAKRIAWMHQMRQEAETVELYVNGQQAKLTIGLGRPGGPIPSAYALAGENLLLWMAAEPERTHRLMRIVTESHINCIRCFDELMGRDPAHAQGMGCDVGEMLSPAMYREFVVPYYDRVWQAYPGRRSLHMCGNITHLLEVLRDELRIEVLQGFGFPLDPVKAAAAWGGRVVMIGGPSPMLVKSGPVDAILAECERYIRLLGPTGGFALEIGGGAAVGTPPEHLNAMVEASKRAAAVAA
jgi:uroporphyrinogen-III decarboxylase